MKIYKGKKSRANAPSRMEWKEDTVGIGIRSASKSTLCAGKKRERRK
jgi:hypothetical protein